MLKFWDKLRTDQASVEAVNIATAEGRRVAVKFLATQKELGMTETEDHSFLCDPSCENTRTQHRVSRVFSGLGKNACFGHCSFDSHARTRRSIQFFGIARRSGISRRQT